MNETETRAEQGSNQKPFTFLNPTLSQVKISVGILVNPVRQGNLKCPVTFGLAASHYRSIELEFDVAVCIYSDQAT